MFSKVKFRFLGETKTSWTSTYLPFGIGPRNCVGARFAEMEFKTVIARVLVDHKLGLSAECKVCSHYF